ncbi:energy transducer TonB [Flavobacterium sp. 9]|uniref:energy transducer TonB n=1 Tax=Flavobacterium sp. 9 TaxID=2035198 RepID=UPI001304094C|nr:energy transducer TonB [Flavobacterium sp. 9]
MTPKDNGRFCLNCSKTVVDFTTMLPDEVKNYFIQNRNNNICGRFKKSQLDIITIQIPSQVLYTQTQYHKRFLLALFIAMGTTLFSCADQDGNKQKIDKIEVVEDHSPKVLNKSNNDSILKKPPTKILFVNAPPIMESSGPTTGYIDHSSYNNLTGIPAPEYIETIPDYPGGFQKFSDFIKNEFQVPKKARRSAGEIEVSFVIDKVGTLNQIKVFDNIGHETGEEIIRVLQESKKWKPGIINGKGISTVIRLKIVLEKDSLNTERRKRKLSKIVSINLVNNNDNRISQTN